MQAKQNESKYTGASSNDLRDGGFGSKSSADNGFGSKSSSFGESSSFNLQTGRPPCTLQVICAHGAAVQCASRPLLFGGDWMFYDVKFIDSASLTHLCNKQLQLCLCLQHSSRSCVHTCNIGCSTSAIALSVRLHVALYPDIQCVCHYAHCQTNVHFETVTT